MPSPEPNESHDDFIKRCIPIVIEDGAAADGTQANAICESLWERSKEKEDVSFKGTIIKKKK